MVRIAITKSTLKNKKYKAVFYKDNNQKIKTSHFGDSRYDDYTTHKDKERRRLYRARTIKSLNKGNYMSPSHLSYYILWGDSTNINTNIKKYKSKFKLEK